MKKIGFILGAVLSAIALLLQAIPATSMLVAEAGVLWFEEIVMLGIVLALSIVGLVRDRESIEGTYFKTLYNVVVLMPLAIVLVRVGMGVTDVIQRANAANPDVFATVNSILNVEFFVLFGLTILLPIVAFVRKYVEYTEDDLFYESNGRMKRKRMSNATFRLITVPAMAIILIVTISVTYVAGFFAEYLDVVLGRGERHVVAVEGSENWDTDYYGKALTPQEAKANALKVLNDVTDEGMILLKNDGLLPLEKNDAVTPFGKAYVFPFFDSPSSQGSMKHSYDYSVYPKEALESKFNVIPHAANLQPKTTDGKSTSNANSSYSSYPDQPQAAPGTKDVADNSFGANCRIPELSVSNYNKLTSSQIAEMKDSVGIVFVGRTGAEGIDLKFDGYTDGTPHYLALSQNEKDMIAKAKELCESVVVVINSVNIMELTPLMEGELEVNAIIVAGLPGEEGFNSLARILCGEVNPSGRTVDIYTRNHLENPVMANYGNYGYSNVSDTYNRSSEAKYLEYQEGVYVGYRYYETAYDIGAANFTYGKLDGKGAVVIPGAVAYPFGYGLSYTQFEQRITGWTENSGEILVEVTVTNVGDVAGKDVVQLYFNPPYTDFDIENRVEKPTATLCAFAKTKLLEAGASQTLTLEIDKDEFTSFVATRDNGDGTFGCYMLEEGVYEISLRANSHDIIEMREYQQKTTVFYDNSNPRQYEIDKQAALDNNGNVLNYPEKQEADPDAKFIAATALFPYLDDYMNSQSVVLSRANWDETVPVYTQRKNYYLTPTKTISQKFVDMIEGYRNYDASTNKYIGTNSDSHIYTDVMPLVKQDNGLTLSDMRGKSFYHEDWKKLLDQIDWEKDRDAIEEFLVSSNYYTPEISSIGLPRIIHTEGANGIRLANAKSEQYKTVTWCMCPNMAATWNIELAEQIGSAMAAEALANGVTARYSPAYNLHRSPFSGRNMEYYSEDPYLTGYFVAHMLNGSTSGGMIEYMKHFALNDQETNRNTNYTWATEQTAREIYMKPYEMCIRLARKTIKYTADENGTVATKTVRGANAMMYAYNAIGPVRTWTNYDLCTELVRNEWNFHGVTNTDWSSEKKSGDYCDMVIFAGCDSWLTGNSKRVGNGFKIQDMESATAITAYRNAIHHVAYQIANSNAMQNVAPGSITYYDESPWVSWLFMGQLAAYSLVGLLFAWNVVRTIVSKTKPEKYRTK